MVVVSKGQSWCTVCQWQCYASSISLPAKHNANERKSIKSNLCWKYFHKRASGAAVIRCSESPLKLCGPIGVSTKTGLSCSAGQQIRLRLYRDAFSCGCVQPCQCGGETFFCTLVKQSKRWNEKKKKRLWRTLFTCWQIKVPCCFYRRSGFACSQLSCRPLSSTANRRVAVTLLIDGQDPPCEVIPRIRIRLMCKIRQDKINVNWFE